MKKSGDLCKVDNLGRIVIPIRLRRKLDLKASDTLEIFTDDNNIILKRYIPSCVFCGNEDDLIEFDEKCICQNCADKIHSLKGNLLS